MRNDWVSGVNNLGKFGRWAFAEFTEVDQIEADFKRLVKENFGRLIKQLGESP